MRRLTAIAALVALAGCGAVNDGGFTSAGTSVAFDGQICGQDASFRLSDMKDRSQATAVVECPGGGMITISTADSSTSAVIAAQAGLLEQLGALVAQLAIAAAPVPAGYAPPLSRPTYTPADLRAIEARWWQASARAL